MKTILQRLLVCLVLALSTALGAQDTVLLMTYVFNRPDFIELHVKTFKAFLSDPYEYVVFNDAADPNMCAQIIATCARLGVRCFRVPQHLHAQRPPHQHSAGHRHMDAIRYSFEEVGFNHPGIVVMVDADMFLTKPLNIAQYMENYDLIGGIQERNNANVHVTYIAPTLVYFNMNTIPNKQQINFEGGYIHGLACDVGAHMYYYLQNTPQARTRLYLARSLQNYQWNTIPLVDFEFDANTIQFIRTTDYKFGFEFHGDGYFIHYYAGGSNWPGYTPEYLATKDAAILQYLNQQMQTYQAPS